MDTQIMSETMQGIKRLHNYYTKMVAINNGTHLGDLNQIVRKGMYNQFVFEFRDELTAMGLDAQQVTL